MFKTSNPVTVRIITAYLLLFVGVLFGHCSINVCLIVFFVVFLFHGMSLCIHIFSCRPSNVSLTISFFYLMFCTFVDLRLCFVCVYMDLFFMKHVL